MWRLVLVLVLVTQVVEQQTEIEDRVGRERLGALRSDIARVVRGDKLLSMAKKLMALHAPSRHALEIQFEGESGFGSVCSTTAALVQPPSRETFAMNARMYTHRACSDCPCSPERA